MRIDLSPWNEPAALVDAIYTARREDRRDLLPQLEALLEHEEPIVREEALALIATKWGVPILKEKVRDMLEHDADVGVRSRAAIGVAALSQRAEWLTDADYLACTVRDSTVPLDVRRACFEALTRLAGRPRLVELDDFDEAGISRLLGQIRARQEEGKP